MISLTHLEEGVISPRGFRATGVSCGLKTGGFKDISLLISEVPCTTAMAFTKNKIQGAHISVDKKYINNDCCAIVINSGNANCLTGQEGIDNAKEIIQFMGDSLGLEKGQCLVASTGAIGLPLNMIRVRYGIERLAVIIHTENNLRNFCAGIMTADTRQKNLAYEFDIDGHKVAIGASAKGASMLRPWLETMQGTLLTIITTDISISQPLLQKALSKAINTSFNRMSIDNDLSPNDSVFILANGLANNQMITDENDPNYSIFEEVLCTITTNIAKILIKQGLGVTRMIHLKLLNAPDDEAEKIIRAIAESYQVKTAFSGQVPFWQKIINVLAYSVKEFDLNNIKISLNHLVLFENGVSNSAVIASTHGELGATEWTIEIDLIKGQSDTYLWTCDLSHDYIKVNAHFSE